MLSFRNFGKKYDDNDAIYHKDPKSAARLIKLLRDTKGKNDKEPMLHSDRNVMVQHVNKVRAKKKLDPIE